LELAFQAQDSAAGVSVAGDLGGFNLQNGSVTVLLEVEVAFCSAMVLLPVGF
jgi:hypothetical protein